MRNYRPSTPAIFDDFCPDISSSRRSSLPLSQHLPSLPESCDSRTRYISPVFSPSELEKTEIVELSGSPSNRRRVQLIRSALERRRKSEEASKLPNVNSRELIAEENVRIGSPRSNPRLLKHNQLRQTFSHPIISKAESFPRLNSWDFHPRKYPEDGHSAEIRRHIQQEEMDYDLLSTKAVILERFLNSQNAA